MSLPDFAFRWHDKRNGFTGILYYSMFTNEETRQILGDVLLQKGGTWSAQTWDGRSRREFPSMRDAQRWIESSTMGQTT